jgi:hypothetical protein
LKTIIAFSFAVLFAFNDASSLDLGVKVGLSASDQSYDYTIPDFEIDRVSRNGITAGVFAEIPLNNFLGIRTEIDYVEKGSGIEVNMMSEYGPIIVGRATYEDRVEYWSMNLLAVISPFEFSGFDPYLVAGPRFDYLISSSSDIYSPIMDDPKSTAHGLTIGAGTYIDIDKSFSILFETSYTPDFSKFYEGEFLTVKNSSLLFTAGIIF